MLHTHEVVHSSPDQVAELTPPPSAATVKERVLRQQLRSTELISAPNYSGPWLWQGYLAPGKLTLLTSQWKSGKTTLVSVLLARMGQGGQLAGLSVAAGRAAVISEEGRDNWQARCRKLRLGDHVSYFCRPFQTKPRMAEWLGLLDAMLELRQREALDLVVIDPLTVFLPGHNENSAAGITECLLPLGALTSQGLSVLLVHHPRKGVNLAGQAARGSGALASHVDILIEMSWYRKPDEDDRRRWLRAYSRHEETRRHLVLELTAAGDDYIAHEPIFDPAWAECSEVLIRALEDASERLTQKEILQQWPEDFRKPDRSTIARVLHRGMEQGLILRNGSGRRNEPYRYWLPANEADFHPGPGASKEELDRWEKRCRQKFYDSLGIEVSYFQEGSQEDNGQVMPTSLVSEEKTPEKPSVAQPPAVGVETAEATSAVPPLAAVQSPAPAPTNAATAPEPPAVPVASEAPTPAPAVAAAAPVAPAAPRPPASPNEALSAVEWERRRWRRWPT